MIRAHPVVFGKENELSGWHHVPTSFTTQRDCAILLCPPIGHEYIYSYRALRHLAIRLANDGFHVLRFDYYGTGDSLGEITEPHQLQRWIDSVDSAIAEVRRISAVTKVSLLGLRFGATISALATEGRTDIDSLVLWAPNVTGKSYLRQIRALSMTAVDMHERPAINPTLGHIEALGFPITTELADAINAVDLSKLTTLTETPTFLLQRDDMPEDNGLVARLAKGSVDQFMGYSSFMMSPLHSKLPIVAMDKIESWLSQRYSATDSELPAEKRIEERAGQHSHSYDQTREISVTPKLEASNPNSASISKLVEEATEFDDSHMFGVTTEPALSIERNRTAVVFLNTGGDHHVGPHRFYASLARQLAAEGFSIFRFDLTGLGDSPARSAGRDGNIYSNDAPGDIKKAIEYMRTVKQAERIILVGLCSGAYYAIHASHEGIDANGIIAINPQLYWREGDPLDVNPFWNAQETKRIGNAITSPTYWKRLLTGNVDVKHVLNVLLGRGKVVVRDIVRRATTASTPQKGVSPKTRPTDPVGLLKPTVDTLLIFSENDTGLLHLKHVTGDKISTLLNRDNFELSVVAERGHTFMALDMQSKLRTRILEWLTDRYRPRTTSR